MVKRVVIVGVGQTKHEGSKNDYVYYDLGWEAAREALADAGLDRGSIDTVILSGWDVVDGRTISDMNTVCSGGGMLKDCSHVGEDGIFALAYAYLRIASGLFDTALVVGYGHKESSLEKVSNVVFDPLLQRPIGPTFLTSLAMQVTSYMHKYGITDEQAAKVVVKNRRNGINNPKAHLKEVVSINDVLRSEIMCWPLKSLDIPPLSVGAVALVLTSEDWGRRYKNNAWIKGIGWAVDSYQIGEVELAQIPSLAAAARQAYKMARVSEPAKEIDVAEIHETTSFHELMIYEALGFTEFGGGGVMIDKGISETDGTLPVNPSGGVLSTNLFGGSGLVRVAEAALQVMNRAEARQVSKVKTALAHGMSAIAGAAAPGNCVVILERR